MIAKDRIFKKGDVIVSGFGNVRILVGETGGGKAGDGAEGVFYDAVPPYCTSDAPAGTDMRYARHASDRERKLFFEVLETNGLVYDAKKCIVKAGEGYDPSNTENYQVKGTRIKYPRPFKVLKKRVRPTLYQIRLLEEKIGLLDEVIMTHCKEKSELKDHLDEVKGCNKKMAKDLAILKEDNDKLKAKNTTLEQSNKLMEAELTLQKGRVSELTQSDKESKEYIDYLLSRGLYARILNLK